MNKTLTQLAHTIATSSLHDHIVHWLRTVPGLPPIVQSVHILSIACVVASIVMIDLRVLGVAVKSQDPAEMIRRLIPWTAVALVLLFISGSVFVVTRPARYFANPVFGIKVALIVPAIVISFVLARLHRNTSTSLARHKALAALSLVLWIGIILAGRWIAYADYLFPEE
jgi:uncharacterized membrane protein SirB2